MEQLSIFDLPPQPEVPVAPLPNRVVSKEPEPTNPNEFDFSLEVPAHPNTSAILSIGDRVVILPAKYSHSARVPGIVKGFVREQTLVRRRDGEGLYTRQELHKVSEVK